MNTSKPIDISKSSLVGLKAELLKKQEEVRKIKEQQLDPSVISHLQQKKKTQLKINKGIEKRILKDEESIEGDFDALKKSREVLEAKSRLYDKLTRNCGEDEANRSQYLIDFGLKQEIDTRQKTLEEPVDSLSKTQDEGEDDYSDYNSDPENDWVEFTDALGRSRKCLRKDLLDMKANDEKLAAKLRPPSPALPAPATVSEVGPEMLSWDMQREMMRQKWEEQEARLLDKTNVHYQDVLYDENRTHGVGYFEFSTNEEERLKQQEELRRLRKETEESQQAAEGLRARRQQQMQARLAAARRRRRQRLGLPPDSPEPPPAEATLPSESIEGNQEEESVKEIEEKITKIVPIRPWDMGKQKHNTVMSQDEWVEKKRQERPAEFAPPTLLTVDNLDSSSYTTKKTNFFTSKKHKPRKIEPEAGQSFVNNPPKSQNSEHFKSKSNNDCHIPDPRNVESVDANQTYCPLVADIETNIVTKQEAHNPQSISKHWKPSLADIDDLLETTKKQTNKPQLTNHSKIIKREESKSNHSHNHTATYHHTLKNETNLREIINEVEEQESSSTDNKINETAQKKHSNKKWAAIPPPATMSYFIDESSNTKNVQKRKGDMADSLSAGMNVLKERSEEKTRKRLKGLLDIV